jgi:signal transduction histidine kinase
MAAKADGVRVRPLYEGQADWLLRAALGATDHGIMVTDLDHTTIAVNGRFGEIWGVDPDAVVANDALAVRRMVADRIPDMEEWSANLKAVYADPARVQHDELRLVKPRAVIRRYTSPIRDAAGRIVGRLWTFTDTTDEDHRLQLGSALERCGMIYHSDPRHVYSALVQEIAELYDSLCLLSIRVEGFLEFRAVGGPPDHPARQMAGNRVDDSYCQFCLKAARPIVIQDASSRIEYADVLPARLGLTRYAGTPVNAPDGSTIGTLCILDDHSDQILIEDDLRLLGVVAMRIGGELERERQLTQLRGDLVAAQGQAVQNEKLAVIGTLAAATAHDIRNILSAIALELELGQDRPEDALAAVRMQTDRFAVLAHRLLSYAKPGRLVLEPVDVGESIDRVLALLASHLTIAQVELRRDVPDGLSPVRADPSRLDHLFVNLILNALQAMKCGGTLDLVARRVGESIAVDVIDTGPGMNPAQLDRLFQPFQSSRKDGFGLGLYSCRQIARESGGDVTASSVLGEGSHFRVVLPAL